MKAFVSIVLAAVLAGLCGCGRGVVRERLDSAEQMMEERPDSALAVLNSLSDNKMSEEERARYALLLSQAYDKNYIDVANDSLISIARDYYAESDDSYHQMLAEYYYARVQMNGNNLHSAMMSALKSEKIADNRKDYLNLARVQSSLAIIYAQTYNFEKALEYSQKDLINSRLAEKEEWEATALMSIACDHLALRNFEEAIAYVDSARAMGDVSSHKDFVVLIDAYVWLGQYECADSVYRVAEKSGIQLEPPEYAYVALANHHLGNQTTCDSLMKRAFSAISTKQDTIDVNDAWYKISLSRRDFEEALSAHLVVSYYTNEALDEATENSIHLVQVENEKLNAAQEAAANEIRQLKAIATIAVLTLISALLCYLIILLKKKYTHKIKEREHQIHEREQEIEKRDHEIEKRDHEIEERDNKIVEREHQIKERDTQIKERDYKIEERDHEIEERDNKIVERDRQIKERDNKIEERDRQIEERDHKIQESDSRWSIFTTKYDKLQRDSELLQQRIDELNENLNRMRPKVEFAQFTWTEKLGDIYLDAKNTHSAQQVAFNRLEKVFDQIRTKKTQDKIEEIINSQRNNLIQRLRTECPRLVDSEIRLIVYSGAGFSTKILGEIFEKRESAIRTQKHRIKAKIEKFYPDLVSEMKDVMR